MLIARHDSNEVFIQVWTGEGNASRYSEMTVGDLTTLHPHRSIRFRAIHGLMFLNLG
jgi:hypothetical protein